MSRVNRISAVKSNKIFLDTLVIQGVRTRKLSSEEVLARGLIDTGRCYVYPDGRLVLSHLVSEALETDLAQRELNEIRGNRLPTETSL